MAVAGEAARTPTSDPAAGVRLVPSQTVAAQIVDILAAWGMAAETAALTADLMVETDLSGVDSHGVSMLMMYERMVRAGQVDLNAVPVVVAETPCTALIDAGRGLGHPVSRMGMNLAVDKALAVGIGAVGVRNSHHFGAAGVYARMAAERGVIGMVTSSTRTLALVPTRGGRAVLGTNPLAFAAPAGRNTDFCLDMATTTAALNKIKVYDFHARPLPTGWVVDETGNPLTDAAVAMANLFERGVGGLTPLGANETLGGHKGYGLAMLVHILGGTLTGGSFSPIRNRTQKPGDPDNIGHFFLAIDPAAFRGPGEFEADLDAVIDEMHATPPADPARPVLVAGEPEAMTREQRLAEGIPIPKALADQIAAICERTGAPFRLAPRS